MRGWRTAVAVAMVFGLAGCGGGGGEDDGAASSSTTEAAAPTTAATSTTTSTTTTEAAAPVGIGGSRYLGYVRLHGEGEPSEVVIRDLATDDEEVVTAAAGETLASLGIALDGSVAWVRAELGGATLGLVVRPADGGDEVEVPGNVGCPRWLPDGRLVFVVGDDPEGDTAHVAILDPADGSVTDQPGVVLPLAECVAPDGTDHVVFARPLPAGSDTYGPEGAEVVRVALDGSDEQVVGHVPGSCWATNVAVDAAGEQLAVSVLCGQDVDASVNGLYVGTLADDLAPLVAEVPPGTALGNPIQYWQPAFSADGTVVVYHRSEQDDLVGTPTVFAVPTAGGPPAQVVGPRSAQPTLAVGG